MYLLTKKENKMRYQHTQLGKAMLSVLGLVLLLVLISSADGDHEPVGIVFVILGVIAILFSSLTIKVEGQQLHWFFGPRFWKKSLALPQIASAKVIKTKWYYGLGIRLIPTGWLYNVSGLTAVELTLKDGTIISLGTDDADNLLKAVCQAEK